MCRNDLGPGDGTAGWRPVWIHRMGWQYRAQLADAGAFVLLHHPLTSLGVSTGIKIGCQHFNSARILVNSTVTF